MTQSRIAPDKPLFLINEGHRSLLEETGIRRFKDRMTTKDMLTLWLYLSVLFVPVGFVLFLVYGIAFTALDMSGWVGFSFFMSLLIILASSAYVAYTRLRRERKLEREGIAVPGHMTFSEVTTTFTPRGWRPIVILNYEYAHPHHGHRIVGRYTVSVKELPTDQLPKPGDPIMVWFYDEKLNRVL
jgi:hypothetical protein